MEQITTIEETNEAICKFMGGYRKMQDIDIYKGPDGIEWETGRYLKYHSSWDWLMPVVEKISTIHYPDYYSHTPKREDDGDFDDCAYPRTFGMRDKEGNYMVRISASVLITAPTFIGAVYGAVVDFVKDYSEWGAKQ